MLRHVSALTVGHLQGARQVFLTRAAHVSSYMVEILHVHISTHYSVFVNTRYRKLKSQNTNIGYIVPLKTRLATICTACWNISYINTVSHAYFLLRFSERHRLFAKHR